MKKIIAIVALLMSAVALSQVNPKMALGNQEYLAKQYAKAEAHYRESAATAKDGKAAVNMGNAIYREKNMSEAGATYLKALEKAKTFDEKHRAYHNLGNVMMQAKDYQAAVDAYQNALRNNPNDEQTRYNYALARQYLKDNPPPKDKGDDKDKKKQPKEQEQKQNQPKPNKGDDKDQKAQPKPDPKGNPEPGSGLSKQRMQGILEAVNNEEKQVQQKLRGKKAEGRPVENGKDW